MFYLTNDQKSNVYYDKSFVLHNLIDICVDTFFFWQNCNQLKFTTNNVTIFFAFLSLNKRRIFDDDEIKLLMINFKFIRIFFYHLFFKMYNWKGNFILLWETYKVRKKGNFLFNANKM